MIDERGCGDFLYESCDSEVMQLKTPKMRISLQTTALASRSWPSGYEKKSTGSSFATD